MKFCQPNTDLLTHQEASQFANGLLALSAHRSDRIRPIESWRARTHKARRQFHSLLHHLIATYDVPLFMDTAWLEGLTPKSVRYQGWYKHVARCQSIRTAHDLPGSITSGRAIHSACSARLPHLGLFVGGPSSITVATKDSFARSLVALQSPFQYQDLEFGFTGSSAAPPHPPHAKTIHSRTVNLLLYMEHWLAGSAVSCIDCSTAQSVHKRTIPSHCDVVIIMELTSPNILIS